MHTRRNWSASNKRTTPTCTDMPDLHKSSICFNVCHTHAWKRCWKVLDEHSDHSQSKQINHTPVPKVACDRIDCCIALPGDGCALTPSYNKSRLTCVKCHSAAMSITPGKWVSRCRLPQDYTELSWTIHKFYWLSIENIVSQCVKTAGLGSNSWCFLETTKCWDQAQ